MSQEPQQSEKTHKVRNSLNYKPQKGKKFVQESSTVPDQTLPIRILLERHSRGIPLPSATRIPIYEEDSDSLGINPKTLDLVDFQQIAMENSRVIEEYRLNVAKREQLKKQAEKAEIEKLRQLKAELDAKSKSEQV